MNSEYDALLYLFGVAADAQKRADQAAQPWNEAAHKVAARDGLEGGGDIRFEKTRFRVACHGTGIYSHESWWEDFPIELLLEEMKKGKGA